MGVQSDQDEEAVLPPVKQGERATTNDVDAQGKETQPPPRLSEASLVQKLEELGIGRPSTYAAIIETVQDRGYVFKKGTSLVPTWAAFAVTRLMEQHFEALADYAFTANLEDGLDLIAAGSLAPESYLDDFYRSKGSSLTPLVAKALEDAKSQDICSITIGEQDGVPVVARVGRYGPYLQMGEETRSLDESLAPDEVTLAKAIELLAATKEGPKVLGMGPSGEEVSLQNGRYGWYVQLGEADGKDTPKRASLLSDMSPETVTLQQALELLSLPRNLGQHEGNDILIFNGRYGPYVKCGTVNRSLPKDVGLFAITQEEALVLLASKPQSRSGGQQLLADLGKDPEGRPVLVKEGRFGPYVTDGEYNVTVRKGVDPKALTLEDAVAQLADKREKGPPTKKRGRAAAKKAPAAKTTSAKKSASKTAAKKSGAKKASAKKKGSAPRTAARAPGVKETSAAE